MLSVVSIYNLSALLEIILPNEIKINQRQLEYPMVECRLELPRTSIRTAPAKDPIVQR